MLKVLKFGGSSMADAGQFAKVRSIVEYDGARRVVVVSAAGKRFSDDHKVTDLLYLCHAHLRYGVSCDSVFEMISNRYLDIQRDLGLSIDLTPELHQLREKMRRGISEDELASRGEYFSARLMADYLGFRFIDAADWLQFNQDATVNEPASYAALRALVGGEGKAVIPGFYGVLPDGSIKTFSRGGSDITGALAAAALDADVYENWTDVSGILMADPRIVKDPEPIPRITYTELRELSYVGAQVLHEDAIFPVREKDIPLNIRNTNDPGHPGTIIMEAFPDEVQEVDRFITGIAGKKDYTIVSLAKRGLSSSVGAQRKLLSIFESHGICVEYTPNGIDCLSLVIQTKSLGEALYGILREIREQLDPDTLEVTENIAIVAAVGRKMAFRPGISGKIFAALGDEGINIRMISQGPQEVNVIVGVENKDFNATVKVLYNSFVK